jgi:4-azaleucine resistance transporter AzlC
VAAEVEFTRRGFLAGVRRTLPVSLAAVSVAAVFGILARQVDLSILEVGLMSALVFAGASQYIAVELWAQPVPVLLIIFTTFIVNLRHLLMGAALRPWLARLKASRVYGSLYFMTDETWALAIREYREGRRDAAFLLGSGLTLFVPWVGGTVAGAALGGTLSRADLAAWGLDFLITAVFTALILGMWRSRSDLLPWAVAAVAAVAADLLLPGTTWYIVAGGLAGSITGALTERKRPAEEAAGQTAAIDDQLVTFDTRHDH